MARKEWEIIIDKFEGFVPGFWKNSYPTQGNKGHASDMTNIDLTDPNMMTQGPGLAALTTGTQAGAVTTLIKGIEKISQGGTYIYGVGGAKFYRITSSAVTNAGDWPHAITAASGTADGEDVCRYNGNYYYSYNYTGAGDIGRWTGSVFDDNYMSDVPTGKATSTAGVPHQMIVGGNNRMYILNGRYVAMLDSTPTFTAQNLDLPEGEVGASLAWNNNRIQVATNRPNLTATHVNGSVYIWDTYSSSWEYQINVPGRIGALFPKNGITYIWYQDVSSTGGYKLGYINGSTIEDIEFYTGSLPLYYQVGDDKNHLMWISDKQIWYWGAIANNLPVALSQRADAGYNASTTTAGGITNAFGTPMVASYWDTTVDEYKLAKFSGYENTVCNWKSILFDISGGESNAIVDRVVVVTEPLATGAQVDLTLTSNYGVTSTSLGSVAYSATDTNKTRHVLKRHSIEVENFRLDLDFSNGSATNPVKIRKLIVSGYFTTDK